MPTHPVPAALKQTNLMIRHMDVYDTSASSEEESDGPVMPSFMEQEEDRNSLCDNAYISLERWD